jgi:hypothetical protein
MPLHKPAYPVNTKARLHGSLIPIALISQSPGLWMKRTKALAGHAGPNGPPKPPKINPHRERSFCSYSGDNC